MIYNVSVLLKMIRDKDLRTSLKEIDLVLKKDRLYSRWKIFRLFIKILLMDKIIFYQGKYYYSFVFPCIPTKAMHTFVNSAIDKENVFSSLAYCRRTAPITICLTITNRCNYNCYYCAAKDKDKTDISTKQWKKIISDLQNMNTPVIFFTGGEPLLHEDLEELCLSVSEKSLLYILTSGEGLTIDRAVRLKECGVFGLGISLTAFGKEADNKERRNIHSYDNAISAIRNSVKVGIFTTIITVLPRNTLDEKKVFEFLRFAETLGVQEVILKEPVKTGSLLNDNNDEIYYITQKDKSRLLCIQKKANKHFKRLKVSTELLYANQGMFGCAAGINHSAINSAGELTPCDFCPISFGNVLQVPVNELYLKMSNEIAVPEKGCMQMKLHKEQINHEVPLESDTTWEIIQKCKNDKYPKMFEQLQKPRKSIKHGLTRLGARRIKK